MTSETLNTLLHDKMTAEQDKFRDWLLSQPPQVILDHSFEYTAREDILMALQDTTLDKAQAEALWKSPSPLADIFKDFSKLDSSDQMETIQNCIESRADRNLEAAREAMLNTPIYAHSFDYALEHKETEQYFASFNAHVACKEAIEQAIADHHDGMHFNSDEAVKQVMESFSPERVSYVLANTLQHKDWDGRFSSANLAWAKSVPIVEDKDAKYRQDRTNSFVVDRGHSVLTDAFVKQTRKVMDTREQAKEKKPSVLKKLHEAAKESKAPTAPRKTKEQER